MSLFGDLVTTCVLVLFIQKNLLVFEVDFCLTLRRPNFLGVHVPVTPDLAKTVKGKSDHSENLARVLGGAKNGKII